MTECVRCRAKAELFACNRCIDALRKMLADLPWWLARLDESATGQARHGDDSRRTPRYRQHLDGDAHPISSFPSDHEDNLAKARHDRQEAIMRDALARGRVNARASELAERSHAVLVEWVRDLCETRGVDLPTFDDQRVVDVGPNEGQAPWVDASTVHVAAGNPGGYCEECWTYHNGSCA